MPGDKITVTALLTNQDALDYPCFGLNADHGVIGELPQILDGSISTWSWGNSVEARFAAGHAAWQREQSRCADTWHNRRGIQIVFMAGEAGVTFVSHRERSGK